MPVLTKIQHKFLVGETTVYDHRSRKITTWFLREDPSLTEKNNTICAKFYPAEARFKNSNLKEMRFLSSPNRNHRDFLQNSIPKDTVTILFNCNYRRFHSPIDPKYFNFLRLVKFCKKQNKNLKKINIVPVDTFSYYEDYQGNIQYPKENLLEFHLYSTFQKYFNSSIVKMFHYNIGLQDRTSIEYADPYAFFVIQKIEKCLDQISLDNKPKHKISCLVNAGRSQRSLFTVLLSDFDSVLTHNQKLDPDKVTRIPLKNATIINRVQNLLPAVSKRFNQDNKISGDLNSQSSIILESINLIQQAFCDIITEDPFLSSGARISEKTLKPIAAMRPFLMVGPSYTLKWLRQQGFCTFSKWWDESYDSETNHIKRLEKIYFIAEQINSYSMEKLNEMLEEMKPVIDHNRNHLGLFQNNTIKNLII